MSQGYPQGQPQQQVQYAGQQQQGVQYVQQPGQAAPQQVVVTTVPATAVVSGGNCTSCGIGYISEDFTICGIILAILCFPIGLICCFLMKERKCSHCGRTF